MKWLLSLLVVLTMQANVLCAAANHRKLVTSESTVEVEVAPGKFVTYQRYTVAWKLEDGSWVGVHTKKSEKAKFFQQDTSYLSIPWGGNEIKWVGVGVPISIRVWNDKLYLVVFDRESDFNKIRFRFYRQDHNVLAEIDAKQFPNEIATQNLWLSTNNGYRNGVVVNELEAARKLDPADPTFRESLTAKIWLQCETGKQYYEAPNDSVDETFLKNYLKRHNVVKLTQIQRK